MSYRKNFIGVLIISLFITGCFRQGISQTTLSPGEFELIAKKIFFNETGGKFDLIVCWNEGENFISLGIGHFIWYQKNDRRCFKESFLELLDFMRKRGEKIPAWLEKMEKEGYPWKSRTELSTGLYPDELSKLVDFLNSTRNLQTEFIFNRFEKSLPEMIAASNLNLRKKIKYQFYRLFHTPGGIYTLTDYVNFKGEGVSNNESYNGIQWGLLQVLKNMRGSSKDINALKEFVAAAKKILQQRVLNAPYGTNEKQWLPGWERRLDSYVDSFDLFKNKSPTIPPT